MFLRLLTSLFRTRAPEPVVIDVDAALSHESEDALRGEFDALANRGLIAPLGGDGSASVTGPHNLQAAASTEYGFSPDRQSTENFLLAAADARLVAAVCQGNEKHTSTAVAGAIALSELHEHVVGARRTADVAADLAQAIATANQRILRAAERKTEIRRWKFSSAATGIVRNLRGIGCSVTALAIHEGVLVIAHIGEGAAYRIRAGHLERLTAEHTLRARPEYQEHLRAHPDAPDFHGDTVLRILGMTETTEVDIATDAIEGGDVLIAGTSLLPRLDLGALVEQAQRTSATQICQWLTEEAKRSDRFESLAATWAVVKVPAG